MNIIMIGCGKVGLTLVKQLLAENHSVSVIDSNPSVVTEVNNTLDVIAYLGNGASYSVQKEAGVENADLVIAVTGSDELNLLCCLIAKKAGDCKTIARVRNPEYLSELPFLRENLGLALTINPDLTTAKEISRILRLFELGRSVVAQCGSLITKVNYVKEGSFKKFAIVDAGMTDLIRPALYDAHHKIINLTSNEPEETYDVVGPICESSDVFDKAIQLPKTKRGDYLALLSAGAYGEIMASSYNCRKLPIGYTTDEL